ncbi:MAG: hypothetical protein AVDCRST_MAG35-1824, partial [uncultured Quadrisphaera sp.]
ATRRPCRRRRAGRRSSCARTGSTSGAPAPSPHRRAAPATSATTSAAGGPSPCCR